MRKPLYFTEIYLATIFLGTLAFNFILACFLSVTFELPFLNLDKLFFPENSSPSKGIIKYSSNINTFNRA